MQVPRASWVASLQVGANGRGTQSGMNEEVWKPIAEGREAERLAALAAADEDDLPPGDESH